MDISRRKACPSCCKIQCICNGLGDDAAKSSQNMEPEAVSRHERRGEPSFVKKDGSPLDRPNDAPWPFTILFVGVDNGEKTDPDLNLKNEFEKIEQAYREAEVSKHGSSRVIIKRLLFSKWKEVMEEIIKESPTILQFGCHSQKGKGLGLFRQIVDPHDVLDAIRSWNESARQQRPPRPEIRIVVLNACDSEGHARVVSEGVDFTIGHCAPVADENAIDFSGIFYAGLFRCTSLMCSFNMAKSCSKGYRLFFPERDPRQFCLVHSDMRLGKRSTISQHDAGEGSSSGAKWQRTDHASAHQSEQPFQVSSHPCNTSGLARPPSKRAASRSEDDVVSKMSRLQHAGGGEGGGGGGQGSAGVCAASLDSTQQTFPYDVFISHAWDEDDEGRDSHERAKRLNAGLKRSGMKTWFDGDQMQGDILDCMTRGIECSAVVLICVTRRYAEKVTGEADNSCKLEFNYAYGKRTSAFMLPVVMEESMTHQSEWGGRLFAVLGFHFYQKLTSDTDAEFDKAVSEIAAAVRTKINERLLPDLQQATSSIVQDAVSSRGASPTPSDQSGVSTAPQTPNQEVALVYIQRLVTDFKEHMTNFMRDFLHQRRLCELLLVKFMRDKVAPSCDEEIAENLETWQETCEDLDANLVISFNKIMLSLKPSILKEQLSYEFSDGNKKNHTSVFVIDWMVQLALNKTKKEQWIDEVVKDFDPNNADSAEDFLERAEKFLQKGVKGEKWGIKILGKVIETNSYVAFFRMEALAALLLREYCSQQKILHEHQNKQHDAQENDDEKQQCSVPLAISLIVSSSNWHLSFSKGKGPSSACVSEMVWHLQRIACLPAKTLETNEYNFSQLESVNCEPLYNLEKMPASMPLVASGGARVGPINSEREKSVREVYADETARSVIEKYLKGVKTTCGSYVDSASGEERSVGGHSISLVLFQDKSFDEMCGWDTRATNMDFTCPILHGIMDHPVKCSDGQTYERANIEKVFALALRENKPCISPLRAKDRSGLNNLILDAMQGGKKIQWCETNKRYGIPGGQIQIWCEPNETIQAEILEFKKMVNADLESLKKTAEGDDERNIKRSRYGYSRHHGDSNGSKEGTKKSKDEFLDWMSADSETRLACLTGPPASGKTVTMQQLVCMQIEKVSTGRGASMPLSFLPLFMRAAELSRLLSDVGKCSKVDLQNVADMRHLVELFLDKSDFFLDEDARQRIPGVKQLILELFDLDHILICIDGLDEAGSHRDMVEKMIETAVKDAKESSRHVHMLLSTREHSYFDSRACLRLGDFDVVNMQPLDKDQQQAMINDGRIPSEQVEEFSRQLAATAEQNPEMASSPFLLSLMIEVFRKHHKIPTQRVELYARQVEGIMSRCIKRRKDDGWNFRVGDLATDSAALKVATDYLETLAFVCQMLMEKRDFSLAALGTDVKKLWKHDRAVLTHTRELVFKNPIVGLLTCVGDNTEVDNIVYRFSHLTLQEYLAAKCTVRLFGHDAQELLNQLQPLHSPGKRMVLQFTACMLSEQQVFESFCQLVLANDDGAGSHCELVQDFLKERGASEKVEQMVRDKLQEIRGSERLLAGLCHPSSELRNIVLSEMKKFGVPPDPFAETDGTAAALRQIAEDGASKWHKRAAAVLSLVQMAQMDHCRKGNGRSYTFTWLLGMLKPDQNEEIRFALVAGLGTLLKRFEQNETKDEIMLVPAEDEPVLLAALKQSANRVVIEAVADLKAYSDRLMDWVLNESSLIAEGVWPMLHLLHVFCIKIATSGNQGSADQLGQQLFGRVHAVSEETFNKEQGDVLKGLDMICQPMRDDILPLFLHLLQSGGVKQRSRVMQVAAALGMQFVSKSRESLDTLAQALLSGVREGCTLDDLMMEGGSLLAALLRDESDRKHESLKTSKVFVYIMESLVLAAKQGLETPKLVVNFLVEFEKTHLSAAAAVAAAAAAATATATAGNRNKTEAVEKSEETNPEEKRKEHTEHSEQLSLDSLAVAVKDFKPQDLSTRIRQPEKPLNLYCAARLWATSGLMQERTAKDIAAWLSLSESKAREAEDSFSKLQGVTEPWLQNVLKGMRDEAQCLSFMFTSFLEYIRERQCTMKDMSFSGMEKIEKQVKDWQPSDARGQLEKQLLLKELRIGRRSQKLPSWTGVVSKRTYDRSLGQYSKASRSLQYIAARMIMRNKNLYQTPRPFKSKFFQNKDFWRILTEVLEVDREEFREDMRRFIWDFLDKRSDQPGQRKRNLCELLILAFMREKGAYDPAIFQALDAWRSKCLDPTVNLIYEFHEMMLALEPPIFTQIKHEFLDALSDGTPNGKPFPFSGGKRNHISIFVIDWMVQHSEYGLTDKYTEYEWHKKVVMQFFEPNNTDSADDFLDRAESFLRKRLSFKDPTTWGTKILKGVCGALQGLPDRLPDRPPGALQGLPDRLPDRPPTPSDMSGMKTVPQSTSSEDVIAMHVQNPVSAFREDMRTFIRNFFHKPSSDKEWKLCELLIVAFMREKGAYDPEIAKSFELWRSKCFTAMNQNTADGSRTVNLINEFNKIMLFRKPPTFTQINHEFSHGMSDGTPNGKPFPFGDYSKERNHVSIFVINWMVQHSQYCLPDDYAKLEWREEVVLQWFEPNNTESADDFLCRAEAFLQMNAGISLKDQTTWGSKIIGNHIAEDF